MPYWLIKPCEFTVLKSFQIRMLVSHKSTCPGAVAAEGQIITIQLSSPMTDTELLSPGALHPWFFPATDDSLANDEFSSLNRTKLQTKQVISWVNTGSLFSLGKKRLISRNV